MPPMIGRAPIYSIPGYQAPQYTAQPNQTWQPSTPSSPQRAYQQPSYPQQAYQPPTTVAQPLPTWAQPTAPPRPIVRLQSPEPAPRAAFSMPSPEALGVAPPSVASQERSVDWNEVRQRLHRMSAVGFQVARLDQGGHRVTFQLPTAEVGKIRHIDAVAETEAEAVNVALHRAELVVTEPR